MVVFMNCPHIKQLIHNDNTYFITNILHCLADWMMRTSNTVKSCFFDNTKLSLKILLVSDTNVVMFHEEEPIIFYNKQVNLFKVLEL